MSKKKLKIVQEINAATIKLVEAIAYKAANRRGLSSSLDEVRQYGLIGLWKAVESYDATQGASFETYAYIRIRGEIIDQIRTEAIRSRAITKLNSQVSDAISRLEQAGKKKNAATIAAESDLSLDEYHEFRLFFAANDLEPVSDNVYMDTASPTPDEWLESEQLIETIEAALEKMEPDIRQATLLYYGGSKLEEIALMQGVTGARISQRKKQGLAEIRNAIERR